MDHMYYVSYMAHFILSIYDSYIYNLIVAHACANYMGHVLVIYIMIHIWHNLHCVFMTHIFTIYLWLMRVPITCFIYVSYKLWLIYDTIYMLYVWIIHIQFICVSCVYQLHVSFMHHINYDSYMIQFISCMYESYMYNLFLGHACANYMCHICIIQIMIHIWIIKH